MTKPVVAIVGRPNVGKSTLFNRILGKRVAIVEDLPGTTRDRIYADVSWQGCPFSLVDTGGLEVVPESELWRRVKEQVETAIQEADAVVFLVDARDGVTPLDREISDRLRRWGKPIVLVANKAEGPKQGYQVLEFYELGLGEPQAISAYHGREVAELLDRVVAELPRASEEAAQAEIMKLAIVGRPNVGKSLLLNSILGRERAIVHEVPGTTRDALDTLMEYDGKRLLLVDTAGIRRRGRIGRGVEQYSVLRALQAIDRADLAVLVLDATEGITAQDAHIAGYIRQGGKGVVVAVNKWDLITEPDVTHYTREVYNRLKFLPQVPIVFTSAKLGWGVWEVVPAAERVFQERLKRIPTSALNILVQDLVAAHLPPAKAGKRLKILYVTQSQVNPPTFVFFVNDARLLHFSYRRYLENGLRQAFGFAGTPLRLLFRSRRRSP
ncbi:MAG TPA: ribosome biogenesis GTPase Der [Dehalococcoidia bacterium]|nr:ribosome biogenesis GTPase Der [Dehalococcoidia bacterium]